MVKIDICSDLHINYWKEENNNNIIKQFEKSNSEYLIIAGDIAYRNQAMNFLIELENNQNINYKKIMFLDGNHEHDYNLPNLYTFEDFNNDFENQKKIIYLPSNDFILNEKRTVIVGVNGWWDFNNNDEKSFKFGLDYLGPTYSDNKRYNLNNSIFEKAKQEYDILFKKIMQYQNDDSIENIIIVTHTAPLSDFGKNKYTL